MGEINLHSVGVYNTACELSNTCWNVYKNLDWQIKKIIGDQWITATDSVSANIAEGYGRFHYLDKIKFFYNARASLYESLHWLELMKGRGLISEDNFKKCYTTTQTLAPQLNSFIQAHYQKREKSIS